RRRGAQDPAASGAGARTCRHSSRETECCARVMSSDAPETAVAAADHVLTEETSLALARRALSSFGFDPQSRLTFVKLRENCIFRVDSAQGSAALRLHRPGYRSRAEIAAESEFIEALAGLGIPVVQPIMTTIGEYTMILEA